MTETLSDSDLRAAFHDRAAGPAAPDLFERIEQRVAATPQVRRLVVLPGLHVGASLRQLGWAAVIGASTLALVGSMLVGGGAPSSAVDPSQSPRPAPASAPPVATTVYRPGDVLRVSAVAPVALETGPDSRDAVQQIPPGTTLFVVAGPRTVDARAWYQVQPFSEDLATFALGWLPATRAGVPVVEAHAVACPSGTLTPAVMLGLGTAHALACFGNRTIEIRGHIACDGTEVALDVAGEPYWLDDGRFCRFEDAEGEPLVQLFGMPWDELPPTWRTAEMAIQGHLDDELARECVPASRSTLTKDEAVLRCRGFFVVSKVAAAG